MRTVETKPYGVDYEIGKTSEFGAFIQVFEKRIDDQGIPRVACISYPLPKGISTKKAWKMISRIAGPSDSSIVNIDDYYLSTSGDLLFIAKTGEFFTTDMRARFLDVPEIELGIDQSRRKEELFSRGVLREFNLALLGERHASAQDSEGGTIFSFSYRVAKDGLYGKDVQGKEGRRLSELAMEGDDEHSNMLIALEKKLMSMPEGIVINFDKSKTVSMCCAKFFKDKLAQIFKNTLDTSELVRILTFYTGIPRGLNLSVCHTCQEEVSENGQCGCADK